MEVEDGLEPCSLWSKKPFRALLGRERLWPYKPLCSETKRSVPVFTGFVRAPCALPSAWAPGALPVGLMDVRFFSLVAPLSHLPLLTRGCSPVSPNPSINPCDGPQPPRALLFGLPLTHPADECFPLLFSTHPCGLIIPPNLHTQLFLNPKPNIQQTL